MSQKSDIWFLFDKGEHKTRCKHCDWEIKTDPTGSTGDLWRHAEDIHKIKKSVLSETVKYFKGQGSNASIGTFFKASTRAERMMACVMLVCVDLRPFSLFAGEGFEQYSYGVKGWKVPDPTTVKRWVSKVFEHVCKSTGPIRPSLLLSFL